MTVTSTDGGKANYAWMRRVSPTGERGPWSEQTEATIAALAIAASDPGSSREQTQATVAA